MRPADVAIVWHFHQPWYRDDVAGDFVLPWVRRRAAKDYLHMLQVLERHPDVRVSVNVVPSLLAQLEMYANGGAADADRELCLRPAEDLSPAEVAFLTGRAAHDDYGRRVAMLAPYVQLVDRLSAADAASADRALVRDLQVWTFLAWLDPDQVRADPDLLALARRGGGFGEADKATVDAAQQRLLGQVIPAFHEAVAQGRVEPLTSPYHHPILPLIIDAASARVAVPGIALPEAPLRAPDDAEEQLRWGLEEFARLAGHAAAGVWPPECAVSPQTAALLASLGVPFALADELVLGRTLGDADVRAGGQLYSAHRDVSGLALVFRDAALSNLIGFTYQSMSAAAAVGDLLGRIERIASEAGSGGAPPLVTIALDGENFKDFYEENATPFLDALYAALASSPAVRTTHLGAHLAENGAPGQLPPLFTGSWVDADLHTWIGQPAHTRAWSLLGATRAALSRVDARSRHPRAWHELLVAEASDWFWWFGEHHDSGADASWDALFRTHLRNAHSLAGLGVPAGVDEPLLTTLAIGADCPPLRPIDPVGAGEVEWLSGGIAEVGAVHGAMRPPPSSVERVVYGAGNGRLHLKFGETVPRFDRAVLDAADGGVLVIEQAARSISVALPSPGPLELAVVLEEAGRSPERVPTRGFLHVDDGPVGGGPLHVVLVATECAPLAVAGDLATLVADTAADAAALGHRVVVVLPHHRDALFGRDPGVRIAALGAPAVPGDAACRVVQGALPDRDVPVLSLDAPALFDRGAVYGEADDAERYLAFSALAAAVIAATGFRPDVVHAFEWEAAPLLAMVAAGQARTATVLSVGAGSHRNSVDVASAVRAGIPPAGEGAVDLLDVGIAAATVVEDTPRRSRLDALYDAAVRASAAAG